MTSEYRYIGKSIARRDAVDIVTGASKFLDDLKFHAIIHGRALRSPHAHARIVRIDKTGAQAIPGVLAVLTWEDVADLKLGVPAIKSVLDHTVRFAGEAVVLVAAETAAIAEEALRCLTVDYEPLAAVFDSDQALAPGAPQLYAQCPGNRLPPGFPPFGPGCMTQVSMGDVTAGFAQADVVVEGDTRYENFPNPMPMESPGAIAHWEEPDRLTLWVSNQAPTMDQMGLTHLFQGKVKVRVHGGPCGGSFGSKVMSRLIQSYAAVLSRATGRPVKFTLSKEEHLATFVLRPGSRLRAKVGMQQDGRVTAVAGTWQVDTGSYSQTTQAQVAVGCGEAQIAVRCPNWELKTAVALTNRTASGIVRGFGGQELKSCLVPLLSPAMARLGLDPFEVLKKNFLKPGDGYFWRDGQWYVYRGVDYTKAMEQGAHTFGWSHKWKGWLTPTRVDGARRWGIGVGVHGNADIGEDVSEAYVRLNPDGSALVISCLSEHGTGQTSNLAKMAAEVLKLPLERVSLAPPDTLFAPHEHGPVGSRGTYAIASAVIAAAEDARGKLLAMVAPKLGVEPQDLETVDGLIYVKGRPAAILPWQAIGHDRTVTGFGRFEPDYTFANCMMTFAEVEVDARTGQVTLVQVVNATDVGQIIDPQGLQGQLCGCLGSAGLDTALFEETIVDPSSGLILNANLVDYKWRTFADLPAIHNVVLETPFPSHRFHAIGVGEVATSPGPAAVCMAVSNAIGHWFDAYPLSPQRVLAALGKAS